MLDPDGRLKKLIDIIDPDMWIEEGRDAMARADSYAKSDAKRVLREHFRELKKYKNNVDLGRSGQNYHFGTAKDAKEFMLQVQKRVNDIMCGRDVQTQTNVISSWVVSLPETLPEKYQDDFFKTIYSFMQDRYGKENVIGAFVHLDEDNPHMHVIFVPEATSRKTGRQTVSSASLLTRSELHDCQADLEACCRKRYNIKNLILNGKTKGGMSLEELKAKTIAEQTAQQTEQVIQQKKQLEQVQKQVQTEYERLSVLQRENEKLIEQNEELKQLREKLIADYKKIQNATNLSDAGKVVDHMLTDRAMRLKRSDKQAERVEKAEQITTAGRTPGKRRSGKISPVERYNSL